MSLDAITEDIRRALAAEHGVLLSPDDSLLLALSGVMKMAEVLLNDARAVQEELAANHHAAAQEEREKWRGEIQSTSTQLVRRIVEQAKKEVNDTSARRVEMLIQAMNDVGVRHTRAMRRLTLQAVAVMAAGLLGAVMLTWWH